MRTAVTTIQLTVPVTGEVGKNLRVYLRIAIPRSRYTAFDESAGQFTKLPSTSILDTTGASFSGKATSLLQLLRSSDDPADAASRPLLEGVLGGAGYAGEDLDQRCGGLWGSLHRYVSGPDAKALFWAFFRKYGGQLKRPEMCLAGGRVQELESIGLKTSGP